jgi:DNA-binding MarR family transcriptional regulator
MSSPLYENDAAISQLIELIGFRLSTATVLFHAAVAERVGVGVTDMKCYSLLRQTGPLTAGELAQHAGLTTGAITGVIDRLEKVNLARRTHDRQDRRRVLVDLVHDPERERAIDQLYAAMGQAITELLLRYDAKERATIADFLTQATAVMETETKRLRKTAI